MANLLKIIMDFYIGIPLPIYVFWIICSYGTFLRIKLYYDIKIEKKMSIFTKIFYFISCVFLGPFAYISTLIQFGLNKKEIDSYYKKKNIEYYISLVKSSIVELDNIKESHSKEWSDKDLETYEKNKKELEDKINRLENYHEIKIK